MDFAPPTMHVCHSARPLIVYDASPYGMQDPALVAKILERVNAQLQQDLERLSDHVIERPFTTVDHVVGRETSYGRMLQRMFFTLDTHCEDSQPQRSVQRYRPWKLSTLSEEPFKVLAAEDSVVVGDCQITTACAAIVCLAAVGRYVA